MEPATILYIALFVFWLVSQFLSAARKGKRRLPVQPRAPSPRPARAETPSDPERQARGVVESLARLESEIEASLPQIDERVRAQTSFLVEHGFRDEAKRLRQSIAEALAAPDYPQVASEIQNAHGLLAYFREALQTARTHSSSRRKPELVRAREVADRLVEDFYAPLRSFAETQSLDLAEAPPVAVISDLSPDDRLRDSPLTASTVFVPRAVTVDPLHWSLVAHEIARYVGETTPSLYEQIYDELDLRVPAGNVGADPEALTRLLFASWLARILGDGVGALFFGPSYLRALTKLYAQPEAPARVTTVYLNRDGTVHAEPPAHVRAHLTSRWLEHMGYSSEAEAVRRDWDERHGTPQSLGFSGTTGRLPISTVLPRATELLDELYHLELDAFAGRKLAEVPGLSEWPLHARAASVASGALAAGERASGSARALVAAAMEAALESPGMVEAIREALYDSVGAPRAVERKRARADVPPRTRAPSGRDFAEALILGELLLEPRRRSWRKRSS